jgi:hypothetical protein
LSTSSSSTQTNSSRSFMTLGTTLSRDKIILILGGGWAGSRLALRDPLRRCMITTKSPITLLELLNMGLNVVLFDSWDESTWVNLPPAEDVESTVITFPLSGSAAAIASLDRLWTRLAGPVFCLSTASVFTTTGKSALVTESSPLSGTTVNGKSLSDRIVGEKWALARGSTVLHLSGTCEDEEDPFGGLGATRSIRTFLAKRVVKSGNKLLNVVHINDVATVIDTLLQICQDHPVPPPREWTSAASTSTSLDITKHPVAGRRFLISAGAYRINDWHSAFGLPQLEEHNPPHQTTTMALAANKIISSGEILKLMPVGFRFLNPVQGVDPRTVRVEQMSRTVPAADK